MKDPTITNKILKWYDLNKRSLPWRKKVSQEKKEYYTLISEFMLQQTQVATVIPYFQRFIKSIANIEKLSKFNDEKLIKLWEGLGYYSRVRNLKKTAQIVVKDFDKRLPQSFIDLKSLPGIGDYTASAISAIAFNKPLIPLDGNIERVLKRLLYLKKQNQIKKENLQKYKKVFGISVNRSSDYAQALMELGALICKPVNPLCKQCPILKKCESFRNQDFELVKIKKKDKQTFYKLNVYKKNNQYLLIKNDKFKFLKNFDIFPMEELISPKNFNKDLNFKISNMNMNIKIEYKNKFNLDGNVNWIDPKKLQKYTLPTFTKKIVKFLENQK
ncbi:A/G-specific adenine glycosylase [Candidatus Pelagibacter sp. HIMB1321]|uniref:A/G-specific adenine glycosylase n=1 Tax=Candidatus Pelagibacter sp. HIMB1321 TaxID=1388755 RepID=UPI000A0819D4|nr:A/G-specific adenine glycosylase [Candidatus Pelagibacter sp. HIMB1321]SMF70718.1 A/G-specific DNA-adenine glycosylase [Candidatus Pelagibacter sp. HIMB1321]